MRILIIGSSGMLGHMATLYLCERGYEVVDVSRSRKLRPQTMLFDVTNWEIFEKFLDDNHFDIIVNCAALLVKASELNKDKAVELNSLFPRRLEKKYENTTTRIIQISTAGVYGNGKTPYGEDDLQNPNNFYGRTKSLGELVNSKDLTIRSDFMGPDISVDGIGLLNWCMLQKGQINGFTNVVINGVTSLEFSKFLELAIKEGYSGAFNLHSRVAFSKAHILRIICDKLQKSNLKIQDCQVENGTDSSVYSKRDDINYQPKNFEEQMLELKCWMDEHKDIYQHYYEEDEDGY